VARFGDGPVARPPYWGGFRIVPDAVEFWQGRPGRLHDRLRYRRSSTTQPWVVERLGP
jgi:pyridoxamine 5'-phosphate oxidase